MPWTGGWIFDNGFPRPVDGSLKHREKFDFWINRLAGSKAV